MSKIVILGTSASGKTCYFYGMLKKMLTGFDPPFAIRPEPKDYAEFYSAITTLSDEKQPKEQRFPPPTQTLNSYRLHLTYAFKSIETFDWDDYDGEILITRMDDFVKSMENANCLLLCIDGAKLNKAILETEEDLKDAGDFDLDDEQSEKKNPVDEEGKRLDMIADKMNSECLTLNVAMLQAADANHRLPPICVMITKADKLDKLPARGKREELYKILKRCFPPLFACAPEKGGYKRFVAICPVSLGRDLEQGKRLNLRNVERPICFATYMIQAAKREAYRHEETSKPQPQPKSHPRDLKSYLLDILASTRKQLSSEEKRNMQALLSEEGAASIAQLLKVIEECPLYVDGIPTEWKDLQSKF